jgi:hypothetical protein
MKNAGGVIGIIAGVFGTGAALVTLLFGGIGAAFNANGAQTVVGLGWGGVLFSFLTIVFGAVVFARPKAAGIALVVTSILGAILGGTLVAIFMGLALIGGVLAIIGSKDVQKKSVADVEDVDRRSGRASKTMIVYGSVAAVVVVIFAVAASVGKGSNSSPAKDEIAELAAAPVSDLRPDGELAAVFDMGSRYTDVQRQNTETEIKWKVVGWRLPVYEVTKSGDKYRVQTSSAANTVGAFVTITPRNASDRQYIEGLHTGDLVAFKGTIRDVSLRSLEIEPAILVDGPSASKGQLADTNAAPAQSASATTPDRSQQAAADTPASDDTKKARTRFGDLSISDDNVLLYQGKPLTPTVQGNNSLDVVRTFQVGADDVTLVQDNGGTGCPAQFYLVVTSEAGVRATKAFGTCSDTVKVAHDADSLSISMPGFAGPDEPEAEQRKAAAAQHVFLYRKGNIEMDGHPIQ